MKKTLAVLSCIFLTLAVLGAQAATLPPDQVTAQDLVMGNAKAPVTMIEYYAQACSVCAAWDKDVFPQIKAKYIDTGKVRYVMRLFPLFPVDGPSYKLTRCVAPDKYLQAMELLFRNQPLWDNAEYKNADAGAGLMKMAHMLGLSDEKAKACMMSPALDAGVNKSAQEANERYGIPGTPTLVINFKRADLPHLNFASAAAAIDAALAAKGVK